MEKSHSPRAASAAPRQIAIRPAIVEDAAAILQCLRAAFEPHRLQYTPQVYLDTVMTPETLPPAARIHDRVGCCRCPGQCRRNNRRRCRLFLGELPSWNGRAAGRSRARRSAALAASHGKTLDRQRVHARVTRHHRAAPARHALLRKKRLRAHRKSHGFLRHAPHRVRQAPPGLLAPVAQQHDTFCQLVTTKLPARPAFCGPTIPGSALFSSQGRDIFMLSGAEGSCPRFASWNSFASTHSKIIQ